MVPYLQALHYYTLEKIWAQRKHWSSRFNGKVFETVEESPKDQKTENSHSSRSPIL